MLDEMPCFGVWDQGLGRHRESPFCTGKAPIHSACFECLEWSQLSLLEKAAELWNRRKELLCSR